MCDVCVLVDEVLQQYVIIVFVCGVGVCVYMSKDLKMWEGLWFIFQVGLKFWGDIEVMGVWVFEMYVYQGKYYFFFIFDMKYVFLEQWCDWLLCVFCGFQVFVGDLLFGLFKFFVLCLMFLFDMMMFDGMFYVEDGVFYMVFCYEWVQIKDGMVEYVKFKDDFFVIDGEFKCLFYGSDVLWMKKLVEYGCYVIDGLMFY